MAIEISKKLAVNGDDAADILRALSSLFSMCQGSGLPPEQLIDSLTSYLEKDAPEEWRNTYLKSWNESRDDVVQYIHSVRDDDPVAIYGKAREVTYAHQNIIQDARLFTSARPVFNKSGDRVLQMIITHDLVIDYRTGVRGRFERLQLCLDDTDLLELKTQCDRAQKKTGALRLAFEKQPWATLVVRDSSSNKETSDG